MNRQRIVEEAREWIGTPYVHQGRVKGVGVDCAGLIIGVGKNLGLMDKDFDYIQYTMSPDPAKMGGLLSKNLLKIELSEASMGDIYWIRFANHPQHLAIISDKGIIHSYNNVGKAVEHRINRMWSGKIHAAFSYRGMNCNG